MLTDAFGLMDEWGPEKIVCVSDARTGMRGVLVIDNTARGMGKGGTRMSPSVTVEEIARLARVMTWKWSACDLYFGGAKAGIVGDPSSPDKASVLRAFARALANEVPAEYVIGLDMGLTERDMAIVTDELGRGAAIGLPSELGGLPIDGLGFAGFGAAEAADAACRYAGLEVRGARVAIQGFGAVGAAAARRLSELGAAVVAVSTVEGAVYDPDGLDVDQLVTLAAEHRDACVTRCDGGKRMPPGDEMLVDADILIPAATQDTIDGALAERITAKLVVEGANLPATPDALRVFAERGVSVVPDFIANAGGVIAGAYAMQARYSPFPPDPPQIFATVAQKVRANTSAVLAASVDSGRTPHETARDLARERVRVAMELRGQRPDRR